LSPGPRLSRAFFTRSASEVAPDLIGAVLCHRLPGGPRLQGRLVEVEAYLGDGSDPASHAHGGLTARNQTMFGPAGRLYVYRSYGIHTCVNVVCGPEGRGEAVLFRAVEPLRELARMRALRGLDPQGSGGEIARGPGRLGQAMGFTLDHDGASLLRGPISLHAPARGTAPTHVTAGPRVGITRATRRRLRFVEDASQWVSAYRPGRGGRRAAATRPARGDAPPG